MIFYKPWDNTNQSSSRYILSTGEVNRWMCWPTATYNPFLLVDRSKYLLRYSPFVILSLCLQKCRAPSSSYIDRPDLARNSDPPVDHRRNRTRTPHPPSNSVISTHRKEGVINVRVNNETSCKYFANKWRLAFNWFAVKFKKSMTLEQFSWRWFKRNAIIWWQSNMIHVETASRYSTSTTTINALEAGRTWPYCLSLTNLMMTPVHLLLLLLLNWLLTYERSIDRSFESWTKWTARVLNCLRMVPEASK